MPIDPIIKNRWYSNTVFAIKVSNGDLRSNQCGPVMFKDSFDSFFITLIDFHLAYFNQLNNIIIENESWLDPELLKRWKIVNQLIIEQINYTFKEIENGFPHTSENRGQFVFLNNTLIVSSLVAYPLLEEIARRISNAWDENGIMLINTYISSEVTKPQNCIITEKKYTANKSMIVNLYDKLEIMRQSLPSNMQSDFEDLDKRFRKSPFEGDPKDVYFPLFKSLKINRDKLLHGRKFEGYESVYISLLISMLYFKLTSVDKKNIIEVHKKDPSQNSLFIQHPKNLFTDQKYKPVLFLN